MTESSSLSPASARPSYGKVITALILLAGIGAFFFFDLSSYLSLESIKANRDALLSYTASNFGVAITVFIVLYIVQTAFSLPGGAILTLTGGFLFGSFLGTIVVNIGATIGATLAFLAARYLLRDWVEHKFGARLKTIQAGFSKNAFSYLMTLRLIPAFPFFLVNLVSGLTRVSIGTYALATALGIIPGSFVFAFAGRQLGTINSLSEIASPPVLLAFTLLGLLALLPIAYRKWGAKPGT
ncbi:MAG: TVP38/TMEM64 family protein [Nitrospira sp.]|nr:TVP38/TMEM64 family protein [Nitrospira sp.]MCA9463850.1 TVP38/TMEM64 family protein [Nitrospira sp.]MCA9476885.1 TVP38/TMEM64 family protein [Nitrospira sp.]MCA9480573.1 TVP38/TMEM64 family protein [Nitrospira sp.]MCB9711861.1 TVP38/TMEM64 family protein [Nitrospiraceae bacterium]